ncbi:DUF2924 domain-containing protein [Humitalea sp. 24SJ18S-53]|uniref:DUF2924 domain-containing protein n=1 Tax=Humitalea sp. 24SJ18S-53 TaxID=3422307 RepID=UPI003D66EF6E
MSETARGRPTEPTSLKLRGELDALAGLSLDQLRSAWQRLHRAAPPDRLSRDLLGRGVAYKLQEAASGGLSPAVGRKLASLTKALATGTAPSKAAALRIKPGVTLIREWHGRTHTVRVLQDGFDYDGQRFASLTQIARHITQAHWSGPRFFGLTRAAPGAGKSQHGADA